MDAEDLEDAFRVAYVDFQNDFMEDLKELFCTTFENKLSQIMSEIASIKQQQLRQSDISNSVDFSSNGVKQSTHKSTVESDEIQKIKKSYGDAATFRKSGPQRSVSTRHMLS